MSRILAISTLFAFFAFASCWGTIIKIPADYPTIQQGIDAGYEGDTVLVHPGTYVENINFNGYNLTLGSLFLMTQDPSYINSTILDGDGIASVIRLSNGENNQTKIVGFTIQNGYSTIMGGFGGGIDCWYTSPIVMHNKFINNISAWYGGGISLEYSTAIVKYNVFTKNKAEYGGGIRASHGHPRIEYNLVVDNYGIYWGGGFYVNNNSPIIKNNTIVANEAAIYGGGLRTGNASPVIINCIVWGNTAPNHPEISNWLDDAVVSYSDVAGGYNGPGNINIDPLFTGSFRLQSGSPCIDTGDPNSPYDPDGTIADMGAFYFNQSTGIEEPPYAPSDFWLGQNYPNPFNAHTTIKYNLLTDSDVKIDIFNVLGSKVETVINKNLPAGYHQATWNADDIPSGVYFYRIKAGELVETKRMVLIK